MAFRYVAYTWQGQRVRGVVDADSEDAARQALEQDQLIPYTVRVQTRGRSMVQRFPGLFRPKTQDVIDFTRQLGSLLRAGVPLRRGLIVQREATRAVGLRSALAQVVADLEGGVRFSDACARHPHVFPDFYVRLVRVGEATGGLASTLAQLTDTLAKRKAIRDKVRGALTYPAISVGVVTVAGFVLITYSLPALTGMLKEFGGTLPLATKLLIGISRTLEVYGLRIIAAVLSSIIIAGALARTHAGARLTASALLKIPIVGAVLTQSSMFFMTTNLTTLLKAGLPPIEAMRLAGEGMENVMVREALAEVTAEASQGIKLGVAFSAHATFPVVLAQAIVSGESRGNLLDTVEGLADYYEQETQRSVAWATELIQPTVIMALSGVVGFVAIAIVSGIYSTIASVR